MVSVGFSSAAATNKKPSGVGGGGGTGDKKELFHVIHKVPAGDSPYVRAKHLQLVDKDPDAAIVWFWKAINSGDRVDSALKDMAVVMKQQDRAEEAIEAVRSFRHLCSKQAQESLDNVLIDLYKKCGRVQEQVELLKQKLRLIYLGEAFNGRATKTARSHGKKFQVSIRQETSRILGNLGWAYMQQGNYLAAEAVYRKAQMVEADANKACNLAVCLIRQGRWREAGEVLGDVRRKRLPGSEDPKAVARVEELISEVDDGISATLRLLPMASAADAQKQKRPLRKDADDDAELLFMALLDDKPADLLVTQLTAPFRSRRLPIFEEISTMRDQQIAC